MKTLGFLLVIALGTMFLQPVAGGLLGDWSGSEVLAHAPEGSIVHKWGSGDCIPGCISHDRPLCLCCDDWCDPPGPE